MAMLFSISKIFIKCFLNYKILLLASSFNAFCLSKRSLLRGCIKHHCNHLNNSRLGVVVILLSILLIFFINE